MKTQLEVSTLPPLHRRRDGDFPIFEFEEGGYTGGKYRRYTST